MGNYMDEYCCKICKNMLPATFFPLSYDDSPVCLKCIDLEVKRLMNIIPTRKENSKKKLIYKKAFIPSNIRWEIWQRDNFTCKKCGSRNNLSIDHIFPEKHGGGLEKHNLQTLCKSCNSRKGTKH